MEQCALDTNAGELKLPQMVERQLIEAATHRNGNSSKWQLTECPLEDPFTE